MRYLLLILAIVLGFFIVKALAKPRNPSPKPKGTDPRQMVRCETCGLHIPADEALTENNLYFCSDEHRKQYLSR